VSVLPCIRQRRASVCAMYLIFLYYYFLLFLSNTPQREKDQTELKINSSQLFGVLINGSGTAVVVGEAGSSSLDCSPHRILAVEAEEGLVRARPAPPPWPRLG